MNVCAEIGATTEFCSEEAYSFMLVLKNMKYQLVRNQDVR